MATSEMPSTDRENAGTANIKSKNKMANLRGLSNAGQFEQVSLQASKRFGDIEGGLNTSHRTFGDISNRVEKVGPESCIIGGKQLLSLVQPKPTDAAWESTSGIGAETDEKTEFIPNITQVEDYGDILPPECRLTRNDISRLTDFWGTYEKSASELGSSLRAFDILMKPVPIVSRVPKLEPLDDVIYMPPPPWE
ncbi:hypothetical protein Pcinc_021549 [Petrolisthes cinctipes]|uniref:Uncharacterized protein n=1 Tax=Petrolisthes cinctipes TaxID=88211 RepID=A0AAE1FFQ3_PETCI|nr:hypothetical protein Pcinc_021549 [Petrolisthes cinctipes]